MTNEELKNIEETTALLVENGYLIKDSDSFINAIETGNITETIDRLKGLEISINSGVDVEGFGKEVASNLDKIEEIVNNDNYFRVNSNAGVFTNILNEIKDMTTKNFRGYLKAEEILKNREENLRDIKKRIFELKNNKSIDNVTRTSETVKLSYALNHAKSARDDANKFYLEQKKLSEEAMKSFDLVTFKNDLLKMVNKLDDEYRRLSMSPDAMEELASIIRNTRDSVVILGIEAEKNKREYEELCKKFGLEKGVAQEYKVSDVRETEEVREEIKEEPVQEQVVINTPQELVNEIKKLNPSAKVFETLDGEKKITVEDVNALKLPAGFKYDGKLGINNKTDDLTPYVSVPVDTLNKVKEVETSEVKEDAKVVENTPVVEETKSRVPSGKSKVTRVRRAVLAPYVKSALCFGALGGVLLGSTMIGLTPIVYGMIGGAGIGAIGQGIYESMVRNGYAKIDDVKAYEEDPNYELPNVPSNMVESVKKFASNIANKAKSMLTGYQENKNKKTEEVKAPEVEEPLELPPHVEEEKTPLEETFENSFANSINQKLNEPDEQQINMDTLDRLASGENYELEEGRGGR